ncbi:MAG TPA: N-acetylmuramoyl-L-alanine amidase [Gemmatimonadaceae bacterium]|jgi:N-acetylmuramoyl-L-alanine amidase
MVALLLAAALLGPPDSLRILVSGRDSAIPVRTEANATFVGAEATVGVLGGRVQRLPNHRYLVSFAGVVFELADRAPFALSGGRLYSLVAAARERDGRLDVPVQFFTEIAPRAGARLQWDPAKRLLSPNPDAIAVAPVPPRSPAAPARPARRRVIVVDAGHGGRDPGMRGWSPDRTLVREKDVTLGVSLQLEQELERRGYAVVMTRRTDTLIALDDRGRIANRSKGDLFISVHVNAANPHWREPHAARGFETYFLAEAKTEDERRVAQMENEVVRFETEADAPRDDPLGFIINDMAQNEHLRESNDLAESVQAALRRVHPGPSRGVKQAGFRVLVKAYMPAVLVEIGFGTNTADAAFMSSESGQRTLAAAIADAAAEYLARYQQRIGVGGGR